MIASNMSSSMKKIFFFLALCIAFVACKDKSKFEIGGKFQNAQPKSKVYLYSIVKNNETAIDSTVLSDKGEFKFTGNAPEVDFFKVKIDNSEYVLIAKNGDVIKLEADLSSPTLDYKLSGADEADKLEELNKNRNQYVAKLTALETQFQENVVKNPESRQAIIAQMSPELIKVKQEMVDYILKFAMDNTTSLASFYAINSLSPSDYEQELLAYADKIKSNFNKNEAVTDFLVRMAKLRSVQVGQPAPDFNMPTIDGKTIKLSSLKGKYVMLDFWASWCQPCRQENPNVVKAYHKYKNRNFTIVGISLDKDAAAWKQAVAQDGLTWTHGSELNDFESATVRAYQVDQIPASFILDPEGKIIAKNLHGEELDSFLNKTLR
ncbi:Peroxiredoxin [Pedobacter westerhofensis]|uniref:Peroxiredoxin n=2 Tax=Pedobacter westerhofensis TaxID=425512 RepID=A0A521BM17_9SPHI|nr:Peroxiredoxin [Pedobacter westerhofensis]